MIKITYIGGLPSGTVQDPISQACFPFENGKPFNVPVHVAAALVAQAPDDWKTEEPAKKDK